MAGGNFDPYSHQNNDLSTSAGARKFHRSASPSTDDARYVAGNRARQDAERARNASNPSFSGLLQRVFSGDPRARDRSTFRNPGPSQGIFGEPGIFSGGSKLGISDFIPFGGLINYMTRRPVDSGATYTMNTQSGTGAYDPNRVNAMIAAAQTPQSARPGSMSRAAASDPRVTAATMQATTAPPSTSAYSGLPADMEAQYSTSPAPLLSTPDVQLEAFTSQPSDPVYMQGGDFDAFVKSTMAFPDFDGIRDDRDLMMDVFEKYKAMHQGEN